MKIFPNPTDGIFTVLLTNNNKDIMLVVADNLGREIFIRNIDKSIEKYQYEFDLSEYSSGIYFVQIVSSNGTVIKKLSLE